MSNYSKTKSEALRIFKDSCNNYPLWSLFELGKRNPVYTNMTEGNEGKSVKLFENALADLYPEKIYTVKMFKDLLHRKGGQHFTKPNSEFSFQFERSEAQVPINGHAPAQPQPFIPAQSPYGVDVGQRINLSDHIQLISAKAKAESDCQYYIGVIADSKKEIADLKRKVEELESEVSDLEDELDGMEEEAEEEEKAKIGETQNTSMEAALASVIKENGGVILENILGKKGIKGAPDFTADNISGQDEEEIDEKIINGVPGVHLMDLPLTKLNEEMMLINPSWKKHLCKLILIGQQKPATFKMFMSKLEEF